MRYALQRVAGAAGVLLVVSFLVYWLGTFIPGDAATVIVGSEGATAEQYRDLRHRLRLDDPVPVQFSIPPCVAGVLLVLAGSLYLGPLYQSRFVGMAEDPLGNLRALLLPVLSVALPLAAMTAQMTRASLLDVLTEPFIVTARAKGLREQTIVYGHALKNALVPVVTLQGYV